MKDIIDKISLAQQKSTIRKKPVVRLSVKLYKEHQNRRIEKAKKIADKIYLLSNIDRVIDPIAYIQTIESETLNEISEDNQFILDFAKNYFKKTYELDLKKKGESPELIDQILKRTGKSTKEKFEKVLSGFNVHSLCERIWSGELTNDNSALYNELDSLTNFQMNELLSEFKILPSRKLARFFYKCINSNPVDINSIKLIFQNKSHSEILEVIEVFEEEFLFKEGQEQVLFKGWLKSKLSTSDFEEIYEILSGINLDKIAIEISKIFDNPNFYLNNLANILSSKFGDIYNTDCFFENQNELELSIKPFINSLIYFLSKQDFLDLQKILIDKYNIQLTEKIYSFFWNRSLIDVVFNFEKSIANYDIHNKNVTLFDYESSITHKIIDNSYKTLLTHLFPLLSISPYNKFYFNKLYSGLIGKEFLETVNNFYTTINIGKKSNLDNLIEIIINGYVNINFNNNLQDFAESNILTDKAKSTHFEEFNKLLNTTKSIEESTKNILTFLSKLTKNDLLDLIMFYPIDNQSFLDVLTKKTSPSLIVKLKILLNGFIANEIVEKIDSSSNLFQYSPIEIALLNKEYQKTKNLDLISLFDNFISKIPLYFNKSIELKNSIVNEKCLNSNEINDFINYYKDDFYQARFIELAYNYLFSSREFCNETTCGELKLAVQIQKNNNFLTKEDCIKILSILNLLPVNLIFEIYELANKKDKNFETAKILHSIFRKHQEQLNNIKTLYYILDQEKTLRQRIYDFKLIPTDSSLTLLLLDGFDPEKIIYQIQDFVEKYSGEELGEKICSLLDEENLKIIPTDKNWKGEFYHQIRIRHKLITGNELIELLKSKKVPSKGNGLNLLCYLFYGEMSKQAIDIRKIIKKSENPENDLYVIFKNLKLAELERAIDMYENYYTANIEDNILSIQNDKKLNSELLKLAKAAKQWEDDYFK